MGKCIDLTGQRFGKLVVIERVEDYVSPSGYHQTSWLCKCDCGCVKTVTANSLKKQNTRSCGCLGKKNYIQKNNKQDKNVDKVVDNMNHVANNKADNKTFVKAYSKFESWLNKEDKPVKIKSIMLYSVLKFANDMNAIDEDDMKKMYGEYMFKQMEQLEV